jgi:hypothetical protein
MEHRWGLNSRLGRGRTAAVGAGVALALLGPSGVALADDPDPSVSTPVGTLVVWGSGPAVLAPPAPLVGELSPLGAGLPAVVAPAAVQLPGLRLPVCALAVLPSGPRRRECAPLAAPAADPAPAARPAAGDEPARSPAPAGSAGAVAPSATSTGSSAPALASTGTPVATAVAGLVLLLIGGLLTWVRACD